MGNIQARRPVRRLSGCLLGIGVITGVWAGFAALLSMSLPEDNGPTAFTFDNALAIEKTTLGGTDYTVNNSVATFELDVADEDGHCGIVFDNYAEALAYCRKTGLPICPSVHLVQGKCKQFDDGLIATLELAVQHGMPDTSRPSKQAALKRLLAVLLTLSDDLPNVDRTAVDTAAVHVATALKLGGTDPGVPARLAGRIASAEAAFLTARVARPIGFWTWSDDLQAIFRQDRFLSRGMPASSPQAIVLAVAISREPTLAEDFTQFRSFGAKLTNPAACVSFHDLTELLGPETDALSSEALSRAGSTVDEHFGANAKFALISYSTSKESTLLASLGARDEAIDTMAYIIEAIKAGRLELEPKDDSGWYDYQWYALETLLLPDKAQEAGKLKLSASYKKRLEDAFRTSLTKHRESHIKRLPYITLSSSLAAEPEDPEEIEIGPEFSAEPTATVYLRYARAYQFLRNALHGVLGQDFLQSLYRSNEGQSAVQLDLDAELRDMALLCYGLYDRLCLEIGQHPDYLPDEMADGDVAAAKSILNDWLGSLDDDPDLARDTRVAVPVATWPDGRIQYWATGGVRLQRVVYEYEQRPFVTGNVEATFVPTYCYLPTDIFLEFERPSAAPLTRAEFRALCDSYEGEDSLRAALGAPARQGRVPWLILLGFVAAISVAAIILHRYRNQLSELKQATQKRWAKRVRRGVLLSGAVCLGLWITGIVCFTGYRTKLMVRYLARIDFVAIFLDSRFYGDCSRETIAALVDLHSDDDPQTRYLASRYLQFSWPFSEKNAIVLQEIPKLEARLQAAAKDPVTDVAANSIRLLGHFKDSQNVDFLLGRLENGGRIDAICLDTVSSLAQIGNPRALETVIPLTDDPRGLVRYHAAQSLGNYDDDRAAAKLAELLQSPCNYTRKGALEGIACFRKKFDRAVWKPKFNAALANAASQTEFPCGVRCHLAEAITAPDLAAETYALLLSDAPPPDAKPYALAGLGLARLGYSGDPAYQVRSRLVNTLERDEELSRAIEAANDGNNHEMLEQLVRDAVGEDLERLQGQ